MDTSANNGRLTAEPDCYETPDVPVPSVLPEEDEPKSEQVVKDRLSARNAFDRFKDATIDTQSVDFADDLSQRKRPTGYISVDGQYEMGSGRHENVVSKYNRLRHEVGELLAELNTMSAQGQTKDFSSEDPAGLATKVQALQQQLNAVQLSSALGTDLNTPVAKSLMQQLGSYKQAAVTSQKKQESADAGPGDGVTYELYYQPSVASFVHLSQLADLERRLDGLEKTLGLGIAPVLAALSSELRVERGPGTLQGVLGAIQKRLGMLDGRLVEQLERRVAQLSQQRQQIEASQPAAATGDLGANAEKITALYGALTKGDADASIPDLVSRLRALKIVHEQAASFSSTLSLLQTTQAQLTETLKGQDTALEQLRTSMQTNMAAIADNLASLAARLDALAQ
eukprot:comp22837_c0_seq1/m.35950 comp22837_c0_seq1/g.35950  ORF comp22837_c0_seq1/g.35950 comp22837_c0_seq1/m.35950 type:complete len:398 (-) comp22837_c0_seq1:18-1211(-)